MKNGKLHGSGMMGSVEKNAGQPKSGVYENVVDEPKHQKINEAQVPAAKNWGMMASCKDFKSQASDQSYGQAGEKGCQKDQSKIMSQAFHAYSDDTGY